MSGRTTRADSYKKTGDGIDPRALRAHRRSLDWKSFRDDQRNKRRNLSDDLSPVKERPGGARESDIGTTSTAPRKGVNQTKKPPGKEDRRAQLEKWREQRELKKKLETNRKPVFKVSAMKTTEYDIDHMGAKKGGAKGAPKESQKKHAEVKKPAPIHNTRAGPAKPTSTRSTRTRNAPKPVEAPARAARAAAPEPKTQGASARGSSARVPVSKQAAAPVSGRVTRSRAAAATTAAPAKPPSARAKKTTATRKTAEKAPVKKLASPDVDKVTSARGSELVFGYSSSTDFTFSQAFEFKPLSPKSASSFFNLSPIQAQKRCSTPKGGAGIAVKTPVMSAITGNKAISSGSDSDDKTKDIPVLKLTDTVSSPAPRRSTRRSVAPSHSAMDVDEAAAPSDTVTSHTPGEAVKPKGRTRRSSAAHCDSENKPVRKTRKSVLSDENTSSADETVQNEEKSAAPAEAIPEIPEPATLTETPSAEPQEETLSPIEEEEEGVRRPRVIDQQNKSAPGELEKESIPFRTPRSVTKAARRRTTSAVLALSQSSNRTPKALRTSFILRHLSPEEGVEVLKMSPMIEMNRRTPKTASPRPTVEPMPSFDDMDDVLPPVPNAVSFEENKEAETNPNTSSEETANPSVQEPPIPETSAVNQPSPAAVSSPVAVAPVENEAAPTTQTTAVTDSQEVKHDIPYFRHLIVSETERLNKLCSTWENVMTTSTLTEEDEGDVRTAIGKAQLLIAQRFKQFSGLIDNCEFNTGEKETTCQDLDGFWDMVYFQVEDINSMFDKLEKLRLNGWKREKKVVKKVLKKKPVTKPVVKPKGGRSKFADFLKKKKQITEAPKDDKENEAGSASTLIPPLIVQPAETFGGAMFVTGSPGRSPRTYCSNDSPRKTASGRKSRGLTPAGVTPLMRSVVERNARRSINANSIPKQTSRRSEDVSDNQSRRLSASEKSIRTRRNLDVSSHPTPEQTDGGLDKSTSGLDGPMTPCRNTSLGTSLENAPSLFTPDQPSSVRRSTRRSMAVETPMETETHEEPQQTDDALAALLVPSIPLDESTCAGPREMELGSPPSEDVEMAAKMKRDLKSEFDKHAGSTHKRRSHSSGPVRTVATPKTQTTQAMRRLSSTDQRPSSQRRSVSAKGRRSVHFSFLGSPPENETSLKVPGTPVNIDQLVPRSRRSSSRALQDVKENVFTPEPAQTTKLVDDDTPATKLARLRMDHTPGVRTRRSMSAVLFTPAETMSPPEPEDGGTINLMSFTPLREAFVQQNTDSPTGRSRKKSRVSLL